MPEKIPQHIVIEGPVGVGKTSLARRLAATFNIDLMLEKTEENPFLPRFYADPKSTALPTQLHFLFQRTRQIEARRQADMFRPKQVADFLMQKDRLFAQLTLDENELALYDQVYQRLTLDLPVPDLVIYLQAPMTTLIKRVFERGIAYEKNIEAAYLERVSQAYIEFFYHYDASPLLIVNTAEVNLADNEQDYALLLEHIYNLPPGRHYFNPQQQ